jgi:hypothetical protein
MGILYRNSSGGGVYKIQLAAGVAQGPDVDCRSCMVKPSASNSEDVTMNIGSSAYEDRGVMDTTWTPVPVDNLNILYFYSADADAVVEVLFRN